MANNETVETALIKILDRALAIADNEICSKIPKIIEKRAAYIVDNVIKDLGKKSRELKDNMVKEFKTQIKQQLESNVASISEDYKEISSKMMVSSTKPNASAFSSAVTKISSKLVNNKAEIALLVPLFTLMNTIPTDVSTDLVTTLQNYVKNPSTLPITYEAYVQSISGNPQLNEMLTKIPDKAQITKLFDDFAANPYLKDAFIDITLNDVLTISKGYNELGENSLIEAATDAAKFLKDNTNVSGLPVSKEGVGNIIGITKNIIDESLKIGGKPKNKMRKNTRKHRKKHYPIKRKSIRKIM
jgi:hypothetical protein